MNPPTPSDSQLHPDIEALRRSTPAAALRGRSRLARWGVPLLVLAVLATGVAVLWPVLFPPRLVEVAAVLPVPRGADAAQVPGSRVQDVGWLEAYPFPITVRPLVRGVLQELKVLEGQVVVKGKTIIGVLENLDLRNAHAEAEAALAVAAARLGHAEAVHRVAVSLVGQKLDLRRAQADMAGRLHTAKKDVLRAQAERAEAEARVATAQVDLRAQKHLRSAGGDTPLAYERAEARVRERQARVLALAAEVDRGRGDVVRYERLLAIATEGIADPRTLKGEVEVAAAEIERATQARAAAVVRVASTGRLVAHLTVLAPASGIVMRIESAPGAVVGPGGEFKEGEESGPGSTSRLNRMTGSLASLYDPADLQLRVDVLYAQVAAVGKDTKITFTVDAIPGKTFTGKVDRMVHEADINQNALQLKIRVDAVDARMRPEMLCRVSLEAPARAATAGKGGAEAPGRVRVPAAAVTGGAVFVYDPRKGGHARRVVVLVLGTADGISTVQGDLGISNEVILDAVTDGEKVRIHHAGE